LDNCSRAAWRGLAAALALLASGAAAAADLSDRKVILVTLDGVRIQEIFGGMDPVLMNAPEAESGIYEADVTRKRYWRDTPEARREALMPFFWTKLAPAGLVLGNPAKGSGVTVRNDQWFSYPGYSEILTGEPQPDVKSNDFVRYPHPTVLEYVRTKLGLGYAEVAQIGSWDGFKYAAAQKDGAFFMNGARDPFPPELSTPEIDSLVGLRKDVMQLWEESSNDVLCFRIALAYLAKHRPRVMWLGLGQSDDWAHARRYDLVLDYLHLADRELEELWNTLQSMDAYRGKTTLIVTADHGRGRTPADWAEHDAGIQGSQDIWVAILGPDTPATGEAENVSGVTQSDVAATMLQHLGLDWRAFNPKAGPPIPGSFEAR
jgi:phosphopentomutase/2,3-bisphosphoglycerate-independent phosphoglycerate mutase family metalloenzyme